jgi:hypothetical protein
MVQQLAGSGAVVVGGVLVETADAVGGGVGEGVVRVDDADGLGPVSGSAAHDANNSMPTSRMGTTFRLARMTRA